MSDKMKEKIGELEAVLFLYGETMPEKKIAGILKMSEKELDETLSSYAAVLEEAGRGLMLARSENNVQLVTKPQFLPLLESFVKEDLKEELTPAALETLSLVAYFSPISRTQVDYIRGVNSSFIMRNLLVRGLVERRGQRGNAYLYGVTMDFLKHLGISRVEEMPEYEKHQKMKEDFFAQEARETNESAPLTNPPETREETIL